MRKPNLGEILRKQTSKVKNKIARKLLPQIEAEKYRRLLRENYLEDKILDIDKCRVRPMIEAFEEYGLKYNIISDVKDCAKRQKERTYTFRVWSLNKSKALKNPAFYSVLKKNDSGSINESSISCGLSTNEQYEATSRMFDQLSLMFGHSFIERTELDTAPLFEGKEIYRMYEFGYVYDGWTRGGRGGEPKIVLINAIW